MKYFRSGAGHSVKTMLTLAILLNMVALPGYSLSRATRPAMPVNAGRANTRSGAIRRPPIDFPSAHATLSKFVQNQTNIDGPAREQMGRIAFASDRDGNFEIYVMDPDGGGQTRLTDNPSDDVNPVWSPDGQRLAFVSYRDGNAEIYIMNDDGGNQTRLTTNAANDSDPAWSPDGTKIAFTSSRDNTEEIYLMNADGTNQVNLTNNRAGDDFQPAWSPDGRSLAFVSNRDGNNEIYAMNADGANQRNLSNNAANDSYPNWSPMRITFQSDRDGDDEIYSLNAADGSGQTRVTVNPAFDNQPSRSSNGAMIAFASTRDGNNFEIYVIGADGSNPTRLTNLGGANNIQPAVQPLATQATEGSVQFSQSNYSVAEDARNITITVTRSGNTSGTAMVDYATSGGTASARSNYLPAAGTLIFGGGEISKTFTILLIDNAFVEENRTVGLTLANPIGAVLGEPRTAILTITDNDTTQVNTNPIDDIQFFVRQQYVDFLAREPDTTGFANYVQLLQQCPNGGYGERDNPQCDRVRVSLSFFQSTEFLTRGYFVYRFYQVGLGRRPTFREFTVDLQRIGGAQSPEQEAAAKLSYTTDFTQRDEFASKYNQPQFQDASAYVRELERVAGVSLSNEAALISDLQTGVRSRAQVLRAIVESQQVFNRYYNQAFVALQYFGYLRRDPDTDGFASGVQTLDATGDYRHLVFIFIYSTEYRSRFGRP